MFELSVASKYLLPRWRQLSVSIISIISVVVISLVVWLIVLFFSVTDGLEKSWIEKLVALTAPVRITPTEAYYNSYYYRVDGISAESDYSTKSIGEKRLTASVDPYDPEIDAEIPAFWPPPETDENGNVKDLVGLLYKAIDSVQGFPNLKAKDYEVAFSNVRLRLLRGYDSDYSGRYRDFQNFLTQASYLGSFDGENPRLQKSLIPPSMEDLSNLLHQISYATDNIQESNPEADQIAAPAVFRQRLNHFFDNVEISELKTRNTGWLLPKNLRPVGQLKALALFEGPFVHRLILPQHSQDLAQLGEALGSAGYKVAPVEVDFDQRQLSLGSGKTLKLSPQLPLVLAGNTRMEAKLRDESLEVAQQVADLLFDVSFDLQGQQMQGTVPYSSLEIGEASQTRQFSSAPASTPPWLHSVGKQLVLPSSSDVGEPVLLARGFRESGVLLGDRGYLAYYAPTATSVQEQRVPFYVAGFYDPGLIPAGGKFVMVNQEITSLIRSHYEADDEGLGNGIHVWPENISDAPALKTAIEAELSKAGISRYWKVETYREFDFTKDLIQQLQSEKNVFTLIAIIIIIVACSNIISMLIILVNDKKVEIGILRSMGASSRSVGVIFGTCGVIMGLVGSAIGTVAALVTLRHLQSLIDLISAVQGYDAFNRLFYGDQLPNTLSYEALIFVLVATLLISLLAGIVPALKAARMRPSAILRSE